MKNKNIEDLDRGCQDIDGQLRKLGTDIKSIKAYEKKIEEDKSYNSKHFIPYHQI